MQFELFELTLLFLAPLLLVWIETVPYNMFLVFRFRKCGKSEKEHNSRSRDRLASSSMCSLDSPSNNILTVSWRTSLGDGVFRFKVIFLSKRARVRRSFLTRLCFRFLVSSWRTSCRILFPLVFAEVRCDDNPCGQRNTAREDSRTEQRI